MRYYQKNRKPEFRVSIIGQALTLLLSMHILSTAAGNQLDVKGSAEVFGGYESNILRNDHNMTLPPKDGGGTFNPVQQDATMGTAVKLRPIRTLSDVHRIAATFDGDFQFFPHYPKAKQGQVEAGFEYRARPVRPLTLKLLGNGGYKRKLGVDEGTETTKLYEYWLFNTGPRIAFSPSKAFTYKASYKFSFLNYLDTDNSQSLDNGQQEISVAFEPSFGPDYRNTIDIEGTYLNKQYRTLGSYNDTGAYLNSPLRTYHYMTIELTYKYDFGDIVWKAGYRPRYRVDAFEGFYTYFEHRISSGVSGELPSQTIFSIDGSWRYRHYPVHTAAQPGNDKSTWPDLVMRYFNCSADVEQPLGRMFSLFVGYDMTLRRTNTGKLYYYTYRNYTDHEIRAGVRVGW